MPREIHSCQCPKCLESNQHPDWQLHHQMNLFLSRLDEQQRRWYVALESKKIGHGGDELLCQITGLDVETIRRGRRELDVDLAERHSAPMPLPVLDLLGAVMTQHIQLPQPPQSGRVIGVRAKSPTIQPEMASLRSLSR